MVGSKCNLEMHVRNLEYPFPLQIEGLKTPFWQFRTLMTDLTAYIYGMKFDIHKRPSALQATRGMLHCLKTT